jgi:UDP-N-acetylmuramoyl-tripeptide--D-alanyl-D-alanine ligase
MPALEIGALAAACGGTLLRGDPAALAAAYSIDTRTLSPGSVFFALRGAHSDGHEFLLEAARAGAAAVVVQQDLPRDLPSGVAAIRVDDTTTALGRCGAAARKMLRETTVLAVTGSAGKTTTKEMLAAALGSTGRVHKTEANLNNELGVPLTLLSCPEDAQAQVLELAMRGSGQIAYLARLADPDVGLVTNVRPVHLEFFRTLDDIAAAKGELFAVMRPDAVAVVNLDDEHVRVQSARHAGRRVTYGRHASADLVLESVEDRFVPGASLAFRHEGTLRRLELRMAGSHAAVNCLAALAAVVAAGADLDRAAEAISRLEAGPGRGRVLRLAHGIVLVDETYNSNPAALSSVLRTVGASAPSGRKVLVLGDMLELGLEEISYHRDAGRQAASAGVQVLMGVGPLARAAVESGRKAGVPEVRHEPDAASAAREMPHLVRPGDLVVVKGSRGIHLEHVVSALAEAHR